MEYIHPKHYNGVKFDSSNNQKITMEIVEKYCLKCDTFMGKEHDFSKCQTIDKWQNGKIVKNKTCPFINITVPLVHLEVKLKIAND